LLAVLVFELLEGFGAAGDDDDIVGLGGAEEVFCYGEADSLGVWLVVWLLCLEGVGGGKYLGRRR